MSPVTSLLIVFLARKSFLLSGGYNIAIYEPGSRGVVIEG
jgi:hypothetical protein